MALFDFLKRKKKQEKERDHAPGMLAEKTTPTEAIKEKAAPKVKIQREHVLISPHITERARALAERGQYTFRVDPKSTKQQVRSSVERMYNVHVRGIRMVTIHEKPRRRGLTEGIKRGYKKAVVALREGEAIDIF